MLVRGMSVCGTANDKGTIWMTEESWLDSQQGPGTFLFSTLSSPALGLIHPSIQWVLEAVFPRVGQPRSEAGSVPLLPLRREKVTCVLFVRHVPLLYYLVSDVKNKL
jgi:hypothetical protein